LTAIGAALIRALDTRAWPIAEDYFRRGLSLTPETSSLRRLLQHELGTALYVSVRPVQPATTSA
jgi:hypothetical protein